jgi:hypothetical protein
MEEGSKAGEPPSHWGVLAPAEQGRLAHPWRNDTESLSCGVGIGIAELPAEETAVQGLAHEARTRDVRAERHMNLRDRLIRLAKIERAETPVVSVYLNTRWADEHQRDRVQVFLKNALAKARRAPSGRAA